MLKKDIFIKNINKNHLKSYLNLNLSSFEKYIFFYLCKNYSKTEISKILNLSSNEVDSIVQNIKKYLNLYNK